MDLRLLVMTVRLGTVVLVRSGQAFNEGRIGMELIYLVRIYTEY